MRKALIVLLLVALPSYGALNANSVWEVRTAGADTNGGGFRVGVGTKTVNAATDLVIDGTFNTKVTSATHNFVAADVGKWLNVTAGTGWTAGWYWVVSTASNAATLDHSPGAVSITGGTYNLFDSIDYSQQDSANPGSGSNQSTTDAVTVNTTTVTSVTAAFTSALPGNIIYLSGTGTTTGWYEVASVTNATTIVVDRATGSTGGTGVTMNIGGSLLTIGQALTNAIANNKIFVKAGSGYTITAALTMSVSATASFASPYSLLIGYTTTRSDNGMVTITGSTSSTWNMMAITGNYWRVKNFILDGAGLTAVTGINITGVAMISNVTVKGFTANGFNLGTNPPTLHGIEITGGTSCTAGITTNIGVNIFRSHIHGNACPGIVVSSGATTAVDNLIVNNTGASSDGVRVANSATLLSNTIHGNGRDGVQGSSTTGQVQMNIRNNLLTSNGRYGLNIATGNGSPASSGFDGNGYWNNTTAARNAADDQTTNVVNGVYPYINTLDKILTGDPYTNSGGADFSLNNTVGAGASCRSGGTPTSFLGAAAGNAPHFDLGAVQHADPVASGAGCAYVF